jgi:hypothetical protein
MMLNKKLIVGMIATAGFMLSAAASAQVYVGATVGKAHWN